MQCLLVFKLILQNIICFGGFLHQGKTLTWVEFIFVHNRGDHKRLNGAGVGVSAARLIYCIQSSDAVKNVFDVWLRLHSLKACYWLELMPRSSFSLSLFALGL